MKTPRTITTSPRAASRVLFRALTSTALASLLALTLVPGAGATLRPGVTMEVTELEQAAKRGEPDRFTVTLKAAEQLQLQDFELGGAGWNVLAVDAPPKLALTAGESYRLSFYAIPSDPDEQLVLSAMANGRRVSFGVDLSEEALRWSRAPRPAQRVEVDLPAPKLDALGTVPVPMAEVPEPTTVSGPEAGEDSGGPVAKAPRNIRVRANIGYYRNDGAWLPADNCVVEIWENDVDPNPDDFIATGSTDALGNFDYTFFWDAVSEAEPDIYLVFRLDSGRTLVRGTTGGAYAWATATTQNYSGSDLNTGSWTSGDPALYGAFHIFTNLQRTWRWIYTRGWDAPKVQGVFPDAGTTGAYYTNDEIHMSTNSQWDEDTISHEWGHHWAASFATATFDTYCNGTCDFNGGCGHCVWCDESEMVAWNEGFANLFADLCPKLWGTIYGQPALNIGDIYEVESLLNCDANGLDDPQLTEGFVAALLRDIVDSTNDDHPQFPGVDALALGWDEVLTTVDLDVPQRPNEFLSAFAERYPEHFAGFNLTAQNCGYADTVGPTNLTGLTSPSHGSGAWTTDTTVDVTWNEPDDVWSGTSAYAITFTQDVNEFPGFEANIGDVTSHTSDPLLTGEYFINLYPFDRAGNGASVYWYWGAARVLGSDAPNLEPSAAGGWPHPLVPRTTADADYATAPAPSTLPGNSAGTYVNQKQVNSGGVATLVGGHGSRTLLDGVVLAGYGAGAIGPGTVTWVQNVGPYEVRGGRHTLHMEIDFNDEEPELEETDNEYGRQWVWTPLDTTPNTPLTRPVPPGRFAGHTTIPAGSHTVHPNVDGFRMGGSTDYWDVFLVNPGTGADIDLYGHFALSGGASDGFGAIDLASARGTGRLDAIVANRNEVFDAIDIGVARYSGSDADIVVEHVTAPAGEVLELGEESIFVLDAGRPLVMREVYTGAGEVGVGTAYVRTDPPTAGIEVRWFDDTTTFERLSVSEGWASADASGVAEIPLASTAADRFSAFMVYRDPVSGSDPVNVTLKLRAPAQAELLPTAGQTASVFSVPDGSGRPLTEAYAWDGVSGSESEIVDATLRVRLTDPNTGVSLSNFPREDIRLIAPGVSGCEGGVPADADTDVNGETTFVLPLRAGGNTGAGGLEIAVRDVPSLTVVGASDLRMNSPDINGDLVVDLADVGTFAADFGGAYAYRSDFVWDGVIDLRDIGALAPTLGVACASPSSPDAIDRDGDTDVAEGGPAKDRSERTDLRDRLFLSVDDEGRENRASLRVGESLTARLWLEGPAAREGIEAWEASLRTTSNVRLLGTHLESGMLDFGRTGDHVVGTGGVLRGEDGSALALMTIRLEVSDEQPAHVWIEGSSLRSLGVDLPVISVATEDGAAKDLRPAMGSLAGPDAPALSLNDGAAPGADVVARRGVALRNAPNPFNPATEIFFELPRRGRAEVRIFDVSGRLVRDLGGRVLESGSASLRWNGTDRDGRGVVSGVYFYRLYLDGDPLGQPQRMTLVK